MEYKERSKNTANVTLVCKIIMDKDACPGQCPSDAGRLMGPAWHLLLHIARGCSQVLCH
jgi:hypothetical protein